MHLLEKPRFYLAVLGMIVLMAGIVRLYRLDQVPAGMSWDEAAIGYNGFAVWKVHRDEWLHFMPISFQSFGDYKAPFAIYLNGIFTLSFGLNLWAVRFPFALCGVFGVVGMSTFVFLLLRVFLSELNLTKTVLNTTKAVSILGCFTFAFSPWFLFFSRAGFESGMALTFVIWGVVWFLYSVQTFSRTRDFAIFCSVIFFVLSLYTYHSAKIFTPLLILVLFFFLRSNVLKQKKRYLVGAIFGGLLLIPMIYDSVWGKGAARLSQTTIFGDPTLTTWLQKLLAFITNYFTHFSPAFLVDGWTTTLRHGDGHWGVLYITELALVIGTFVWFAYKKWIVKDTSILTRSLNRLLLFGVIWILIGFLPAAIGFEVPHANRALLSYPGFIIIEVTGLFELVFQLVLRAQTEMYDKKPSKLTLILQTILSLGILIHSLLVISFFHDYFTRYALDSVEAFNYGYEQVFEKVIAEEPYVDKIMFTSAYGEPYIYSLFYRKTSPILYHGGSLAKFEFPDKINEGDLIRKNALIIANPKELDPSLADSLIVAPNGEVRFVIIETPPEPAN